MKTAVEWLEEKFNNYDINTGKAGFRMFLKQAKEMEKQKIIDAYEISNISMMTAEQYYNETFKNEQYENIYNNNGNRHRVANFVSVDNSSSKGRKTKDANRSAKRHD